MVEAAPESVGRLVVPSVGIDSELHTMEAMDGDFIDPPGFADPYLLLNPGYGMPGDDSMTTYLAIHSWRGGNALGNALLDAQTGQPRVQTGAAIFLDGVEYQVQVVNTVVKPDFRHIDEVFDASWDLVIFTCRWHPSGGPSDAAYLLANQVVPTATDLVAAAPAAP
ncbi:hypothetical protein [Salinibacterium sp. ZJ450]|uniref:hypothetical protein n=1 Tax=Salinibacterium sp. ZJ450 TaxID=2708338 RepID=UPI00142498EF|nr:hypothetical protein [Salinibacterium sp. ZJ450]